jgi:DNA repair protein RadA/Sms
MKEKVRYICGVCGHEEPKWLGRCPDCGSWNSFSESVKAEKIARRHETYSIPLESIELEELDRLDTGIGEIDRVLGGGLMRGCSVLVGGEPGIGKSTLMLQLAASLKTKGRILYVTGEESAAQMRIRADRLGLSQQRIEILCETDLGIILAVLERLKPILVIVDSIQAIYCPESGSAPGTVTQIKHCSQEISDRTKARGSCLFLIGHVTKEGIIAGPKVIEHIVDTVIYFDQAGTEIRLIRATKNRFGSTDEIGIFQMTGKGLIPVHNPALLFLEHRDGDLPAGVAISPVYEGSRILLVEIQSLVVPAKGGISRVFSDRIDSRRVSRIAAVLERHLNLRLSEMDIYVNVAGGIRIDEVGIDLALAMALYSAKMNLTLPALSAVLGEVSLAGEIRCVNHIDRRVKSAREMGFERIIGPVNREAERASQMPSLTASEKEQSKNSMPYYTEVKDLKQAMRVGFG